MNTLYEFEVIQNVTSKYEEKSTNDKGEEVTVTKTKSEKKPVKFMIRKPNRRLYEDGELFYAVKLSEGIKAGLLTKAYIVKKFQKALEEEDESRERKEYAELYYRLLKYQEELERLRLNLENEDEDYRSKKAAECVANIQATQVKIQEYELAQNNLFDQTAEKRAQNQTIMWWVLYLAYENKGDGKYEPVFGDGDYDDRIEDYDRIEEKNEPFWTEVIKKYAYFVTFWYLNGVNSKEQFDEVANMFSRDNFEEKMDEELENADSEKETKSEEKSSEEAPVKEEAETEKETAEEKKEEATQQKPKRGRKSKKKKEDEDNSEESTS